MTAILFAVLLADNSGGGMIQTDWPSMAECQRARAELEAALAENPKPGVRFTLGCMPADVLPARVRR